MSEKHCYLAGAVFLVLGLSARAAVRVATGFSATGSDFAFTSVPLPANNDAATAARFVIVDGTADRNGGGLGALHDGQVPSGEDQPSKNFFFQAGTDGGRLQVDLGRAIAIRRISSYSWHAGARAPQVYALYAATGTDAAFIPEPKRGADPLNCGWTFLTRVDTRVKDEDGCGQHGVAVESDSGAIGAYRYLLFDIQKTESRDPFGNTFFSEIDVIDANGPAPVSGIVAVPKIQATFDAGPGQYRFTVDATDAPELLEWAVKVLKPVVQAWYPKVAELLASDGYRAPAGVVLRFRADMGGTLASASGAGVNLNAVWFRREMQREACGAVVHELVHVVQNYGRANRTNPKPVATPGWIVEGIADYVRWFLYEPQSRGAEITTRNLEGARYDGSYRITANFLNWVTQNYDKELVRKLNAVAREGRYDESLWQTWTGKNVRDLGDDWKSEHTRRLK